MLILYFGKQRSGWDRKETLQSLSNQIKLKMVVIHCVKTRIYNNCTNIPLKSEESSPSWLLVDEGFSTLSGVSLILYSCVHVMVTVGIYMYVKCVKVCFVMQGIAWMNGAGKLSPRRGVEQWLTMTQAPVCADAHLDYTIMVGCIPPIESSIYKRKKNKDKKQHKFTLHAHCWEGCAVYQSSCRNVTESLKHTSFNSNE